jgi:quinol-cytochrome oxidoreductase complex cytochrome b subunit
MYLLEMLPLLLLILVIFTNARLASSKGLNPFLWTLISLVAFSLAYLFLGGIYLVMVYKGAYTKPAIEAWVQQNPLSVLFMLMLGVGGMLVVRYIIERNPGKRS